MGSLDPYPNPGGQKFIFWSAGCSLLRAEGFSCSLQFLIKSLFFFLQFLVIKTLDPDWIQIQIRIRIHFKCWIQIRIRIGIQLIRIHSSACPYIWQLNQREIWFVCIDVTFIFSSLWTLQKMLWCCSTVSFLNSLLQNSHFTYTEIRRNLNGQKQFCGMNHIHL